MIDLCKKILIAACVLLFLALAPLSVRAASVDVLGTPCSGAPADSTVCKSASDGKGKDRLMGKDGIITKITQAFVYVTGAVSVIVIIVSGFRYVVSNGDSGAVSSAKNAILYAAVGLVVTLLAQVIVSFVIGRLR
jgi:hypothetical protein